MIFEEVFDRVRDAGLSKNFECINSAFGSEEEWVVQAMHQ